MPTFTYRLEIDSDYGDETEEQIRDAVEEALRSLGEVGIKLTHVPDEPPPPRPKRMIPRRDDLVLVHADGGKCHGTRLVNRVCPGCGLVPDMQSMELWPPEEVR